MLEIAFHQKGNDNANVAVTIVSVRWLWYLSVDVVGDKARVTHLEEKVIHYRVRYI